MLAFAYFYYYFTLHVFCSNLPSKKGMSYQTYPMKVRVKGKPLEFTNFLKLSLNFQWVLKVLKQSLLNASNPLYLRGVANVDTSQPETLLASLQVEAKVALAVTGWLVVQLFHYTTLADCSCRRAERVTLASSYVLHLEPQPTTNGNRTEQHIQSTGNKECQR